MDLINLLPLLPAHVTTKLLDLISFVSALSVAGKLLSESIRASFKSWNITYLGKLLQCYVI